MTIAEVAKINVNKRTWKLSNTMRKEVMKRICQIDWGVDS
jgi:hypothetical protein